jgi:hypothetical protein
VSCRPGNSIIKIPNKFAFLENLNDSEDINRAWENIKENIITSAKESLGKRQKFSLEQARKFQMGSRCVAVLLL